MPAIEKRKRQLRKIFALSSTDDRELILTAKDKGFIQFQRLEVRGQRLEV